MRTLGIYAINCLVLLLSTVVMGQENKTSEPVKVSESDKNVISVGLKGGVSIPQVSSTMATSFYVHLEGTYMFPFWRSRLGLITAFGYSQPSASGSGEDPRLPDGTYSWEATQRELTWDFGAILKIRPWDSQWNTGFTLGSRLMFQSTLTNGESGGETFGEHDEKATFPGLFCGVQGEYTLGPGALFAELSVASSFQDLRTTGDLALTSIGIMIGYRFVFPI